jgi:urease accessory protein
VTPLRISSELNSPIGWQGKLDLAFAYAQEKTSLVHCQVQAPLKVQRPFYPEGNRVCHSVILHTAGGIVGGDRLALNVTLQPQAQVLITTAAAGKIYRSNGLQARQTTFLEVSAGACLEWLPQETIVFNQAIYRQDLRIELAPGATWLGWEITRLGRSARGERFLQGQWRSHTEVWQQGHPLWIDRQWLQGGEPWMDSPNGLAGCPVIASLAWLGAPISPELLEKIRLLWDTTNETSGFADGNDEAAVTRLQSGLLCRYRGNSTQVARRWLIAVWQLIRLSSSRQTACLPGVWSL